MKKALILLIILIVVAGAAWGLWESHVNALQQAAHQKAILAAAPSKLARSGPTGQGPASMRTQWQEYRQAREEVLRNDPEIAVEYKALLAEINQQEEEIESAMVKADPRLGRTVAKLVELRKKGPPSQKTSPPETSSGQ